MYTKVHVSKLSKVMHWLADFFGVINKNGMVIIAKSDSGNPKGATTIYDASHNPINEDTPLPITPVG